MEKGLVSIITPCYNGEKFIDRYFKAILAQTYSKLEVIFVNDGSTDKTDTIVKSYLPLLEEKGIRTRYIIQSNQGQAVALNRGLEIFEGEFLTWPDSDDILTEDSIEKKVNFLQTHLEYGMVRSNGIYYNMETNEKKRISSSADNNDEHIFEKLLLMKTYGCCGCYMMRADLFYDIYPDKKIFESRCGQNWQMLVPAASRSKCGYIDEDLYIVYEHSDSHSRNNNIDYIKRWDDFTTILLEAIKVSKCDYNRSEKLVKENCVRQQFYYAIALKDKNLLRKKYKSLRQFKTITLKEKLLYFKHICI